MIFSLSRPLWKCNLVTQIVGKYLIKFIYECPILIVMASVTRLPDTRKQGDQCGILLQVYMLLVLQTHVQESKKAAIIREIVQDNYFKLSFVDIVHPSLDPPLDKLFFIFHFVIATYLLFLCMCFFDLLFKSCFALFRILY